MLPYLWREVWEAVVQGHQYGVYVAVISVRLVSSDNIYTTSQSHQLHSAHWDGSCGLEGEEEWAQHALRTLAELDSAAALGEALEDVKM